MMLPVALEVHITKNETFEVALSKSVGIKLLAQFLLTGHMFKVESLVTTPLRIPISLTGFIYE